MTRRYEYDLQLSWEQSDADPHLVACYASDCQQPTIANAQFFVSVHNKATRTKHIIFSPESNAPVSAAAFDRGGDMHVAIVSQVQTKAWIQIQRDPCSYLECVHGSCVNQACQCDTPSITNGKYVHRCCTAQPCGAARAVGSHLFPASQVWWLDWRVV